MKTRTKVLWACGLLVLMLITPPIVGRILTPSDAGSAGLERRFAKQIERLAEIASDPGQWNTSVEVCEADRRLFNDPSILQAYVEPTSGSHLIVGNKDFDWSSEMSLPLDFGGRVRMARLWYTTKSGSRIAAVSYGSQRVDRSGQTVAFTLIVDINQFRR